MLVTTIQETLDQLDEELELLISHLSSENPEDREIAEKIFTEHFLPRLETKIDGYVKAIKTQESLAKVREEEAKRISKLAESSQSKVLWLKQKLQNFMENRVAELGEKGKRLESKFCKISLCQNGGKTPIWINPNLKTEDFPQEFIEYIPRLNNNKLTEAIIAQGEIYDEQGRLVGKTFPRGQHIRIS